MINPLAFLVAILGCAAIIIAYVSLVNHERAELLSETLQEHTLATGALISHLEALEAYTLHIEACERYNRAVAAGFMLTAQAVDSAERMTMEGENVP